MKAIIFDSETTGFDEPIRIVEAAFLAIDDNLHPTFRYCERFNPERNICFGAMAVHHITATDVEHKPSYTTFELPPEVEYIVGHKVDFDWEAIGRPETNSLGRPIKRICTLALCRKHFPDTDSHTQGAMMYFLFGPSAREQILSAHNALADVGMCLDIFHVLWDKLEPTDMEDMWLMSEEARIPLKIDFGKHDGMLITELPPDYKHWLIKQDWLDPYLRIAIMQTRKN